MAADGDLKLSNGKEGIKKMLWPMIVAVLVLAIGGYFYFLKADSPAPASSVLSVGNNEAAQGNQLHEAEGSALYIALPRPFVFNVPGAVRDRLVQIKVQLLVRGSNNEAVALRHIPLIESSLLAAFSSANADELITITGKDALKNKALSDLQRALLEVAGIVVVEEVLFTSFVMQ